MPKNYKKTFNEDVSPSIFITYFVVGIFIFLIFNNLLYVT